VEYHANGGGGANRRTSVQLSFEGSWILLLNIVIVTEIIDTKIIRLLLSAFV